MRSNQPRLRRSPAGFTIIELMIAVVVVAVLLAVALPSFMDSMRKGRRSEAFTALSAVQLAQERWRSNQSTYTTSLAAPPAGLGIVSPTTPAGYYNISVPSATATGYVATADGSSSSQANDGQCAKLGVQIDAGAILYAGTDASGTLTTYSATNPCWSR